MKHRFLILATLAALTVHPQAELPSGGAGNTGGPVPIQTNQVGGADKTNHIRTFVTGTDGGLVLGDADNGNRASVTTNRALSTQLNVPVFFHTVEGTTLNSQIWVTTTSTYTIAQATGGITLNSGASVGTGKYATLSSIKYLPLYGNFPLEFHAQAAVNTLPEANATMELGLGVGTTTTAPSDFIGFRWDTTTMKCVVANNSVELSLPIQAPTITAVHMYRILVSQGKATFFIDGVQQAEIVNASGGTFPTSVARLPVFARVWSGGSAPATAPELTLGQCYAMQKDHGPGYSRQTALASLGRGAYQNPLSTFTGTPNHANSTSPSSATLSNTAAGYTTLGGRYQFASIGSAATDYALFAYTNSAGYQLFVTRVRISAVITGAANATTATILDWGVGVNASAVSLATTDSGNATWAPRRIPLGTQAFLTSSAIGTVANDIDVAFDPPLVVDPSRFLHIILQVPVMTATASEVIRGDVVINGWSE